MSQKMQQLKHMLCKELDEVTMKGQLSMGDLEIVNKLTDTIKNIDKIEMLEGDQHVDRSYGMSYDDDMTYADRGYSGRRSYRMSGADQQMVSHLRQMLNKNIGQQERQSIEWALRELEK